MTEGGLFKEHQRRIKLAFEFNTGSVLGGFFLFFQYLHP